MSIKFNRQQLPYFIGIGFLLCATAVELSIILFLNQGKFTYTIDDTYIHLALAENIWHGHYGLNSANFSAAASSIIWPFLIAPFSAFEYSALILNIISAIATVIIYIKILNATLHYDNERTKLILVSVAIIFLILATNIIGLVFIGMEHSLQLFSVTLIVYGLIYEIEKGKATWWLLLAIVVAPLIRYENLAISFAAIIYLFLNRYFKQSLSAAFLIILFVSGFSVFLLSLGLEAVPSSLVVKSNIIQSRGDLNAVIFNLEESFYSHRPGIIMSYGILMFIIYFLISQDKKKKRLVLVSILAVFAHFIAGRYNWYNRYEIYVLSYMILVMLYVWSPFIKIFIEKFQTKPFTSFLALFWLPVLLAGLPYIHGLHTLPVAANNIYEQHYQMHRFAVDYYNKPVAVNDLGYVSYKNLNYVLDLAGLSSEEVLRVRDKYTSSNWMKSLCDKHDVGLVMIYKEWYRSIPEEWVEIGKISLSRKRITPAYKEVTFYATNQDEAPIIEKKFRLFSKTLPPGVTTTFAENIR